MSIELASRIGKRDNAAYNWLHSDIAAPRYISASLLYYAQQEWLRATLVGPPLKPVLNRLRGAVCGTAVNDHDLMSRMGLTGDTIQKALDAARFVKTGDNKRIRSWCESQVRR